MSEVKQFCLLFCLKTLQDLKLKSWQLKAIKDINLVIPVFARCFFTGLDLLTLTQFADVMI